MRSYSLWGSLHFRGLHRVWRGLRQWGGAYTGWREEGRQAIFYSKSVPSFVLTASSSDLKQLRYKFVDNVNKHKKTQRHSNFFKVEWVLFVKYLCSLVRTMNTTSMMIMATQDTITIFFLVDKDRVTIFCDSCLICVALVSCLWQRSEVSETRVNTLQPRLSKDNSYYTNILHGKIVANFIPIFRCNIEVENPRSYIKSRMYSM